MCDGRRAGCCGIAEAELHFGRAMAVANPVGGMWFRAALAKRYVPVFAERRSQSQPTSKAREGARAALGQVLTTLLEQTDKLVEAGDLRARKNQKGLLAELTVGSLLSYGNHVPYPTSVREGGGTDPSPYHHDYYLLRNGRKVPAIEVKYRFNHRETEYDETAVCGITYMEICRKAVAGVYQQHNSPKIDAAAWDLARAVAASTTGKASSVQQRQLVAEAALALQIAMDAWKYKNKPSRG